MDNSGHCGCDSGGGGGANPFDQFLNKRNQVQFSSVDIVPTPGFGDGHLTVGGPATFNGANVQVNQDLTVVGTADFQHVRVHDGLNVETPAGNNEITLQRDNVTFANDITFVTADTLARYWIGMSSTQIGSIADNSFVLLDQASSYIHYTPYQSRQLMRPNQIAFTLRDGFTVQYLAGDPNVPRSFLQASPTLAGPTTIPRNVLIGGQSLEVDVEFEYSNEDPISQGFELIVYLNEIAISSCNFEVSGGSTTLFPGYANFKINFVDLDGGGMLNIRWGTQRYARSFVTAVYTPTLLQSLVATDWGFAASGLIDPTIFQTIDLRVGFIGTGGRAVYNFGHVAGRLIV